jgi:hypothetical protein
LAEIGGNAFNQAEKWPAQSGAFNLVGDVFKLI